MISQSWHSRWVSASRPGARGPRPAGPAPRRSRWSRGFIHGLLVLGLVLASGVVPSHSAAQQLSPDLQAAMLLLQADREIRAEEYRAASATLGKLKGLYGRHGMEVPDGYWFMHAQVAMASDSAAQARASLMKYLDLTGKRGEHYMEAVELLSRADALLAAAEFERRAPARRQSMADGEREGERLLAQAEAASPGRVFRDCPVCPVMVEVPAGTYLMGSSDSEGAPDERPRHGVTIGSPIAVGAYEVTFAEWDSCVERQRCREHHADDRGWGRGRRPVVDVNWEDAREYARWLSEETGERYRLLSEAEWEYLARAGAQTARHWGPDDSEQCRYANGNDESVQCSDGYERTAPVGSFEPNALGLYDMIGNVIEWTDDCWNGNYKGAPVDGGAWHSGDCSRRVLRGGSWSLRPGHLRSAVRAAIPAGERLFSLGFRVARALN